MSFPGLPCGHILIFCLSTGNSVMAERKWFASTTLCLMSNDLRLKRAPFGIRLQTSKRQWVLKGFEWYRPTGQMLNTL